MKRKHIADRFEPRLSNFLSYGVVVFFKINDFRNSWIFHGSHGDPMRTPWGPHGDPMGTPWEPMGTHGDPWEPMGTQGTQLAGLSWPGSLGPIWRCRGFWHDRTERKHILRRNRFRVSNFLSHGIVESLISRIFEILGKSLPHQMVLVPPNGPSVFF